MKMRVFILQLVFLGGAWRVQANVLSPELDIYTELKDLRAQVEKLKTKLETAETELTEQKAKWAKLEKERDDQPKVAFTAATLVSESQNYGPFNTETNLAFGKVLTNIGNAYDYNSGVFTAPVKGVYYFRFSGYGNARNDMGLSLFVAGKRSASTYDYKSADHNDNASNGVTAQLEAGEKVYMTLWVNTWIFMDRRYDYCTFSGFLLFPL